MATDWNKIFEEEYAFSQNGVSEEAAKYEELLAAELSQLLSEEQKYQAQLEQERDQRLREAYIVKQNAVKNAPVYLAGMGLTGGVSETVLADIMREYYNARNQAGSDYTIQSGEAQSDYQKNKNDVTLKYRQLISDANEAARSAALQRANFAKARAKEEEEKAAAAAKSSSKKSSSSGSKSKTSGEKDTWAAEKLDKYYYRYMNSRGK